MAILQIYPINIKTIYNKKHKSCFISYTYANAWLNKNTNADNINKLLDHDDIFVQPITYSMKMLFGSVDLVEKLLVEKDVEDKIDGSGRKKIAGNIILDVSLCPGIESAINNDTVINDYNETMKTDTDETLGNNTTDSSSLNDRKLKRKLLTLSNIQKEKLRRKLVSSVREFKHKLYWAQQNASSDTLYQNQRIMFWNNILSMEGDNNKLNYTQICRKIYDKLNLTYSSIYTGEETMTTGTTTSHLISIDFSSVFNDIRNLIEPDNNIVDGNTKTKMMVLNIAKKCVNTLLLSITLQDEVCSIQTRPSMQVQNSNAAWLIQTIDGKKGYTPMYNFGLSGADEVIAVSDTGLDINHCYFDNGNELEFGLPVSFGIRTLIYFCLIND